MSVSSILRRVGIAFVVISALTTAIFLLPSAPSASAAAPVTTDRTEAAAGWLASQLVNGDHFESEFDGTKFPDQGLTIDALFAFAAAGVADDAATRATNWLSQSDIMTGYLGDGVTESYAGSHAKLALAAQVRGINPISFGGVNLIDQLLTLQADSGRFSDKSQFGDFSNAFSQSLAIIALNRTTPAHTEQVNKAADFLVNNQCADGGFSVQFDPANCTSDVDASAMAVQALLAAGQGTAANKALDWLVNAQHSDGSFVGSPPANIPNANSTGLASQALRAGDRNIAADKGVSFLTGLQVGCSGPEANRGGIALDTSGFDAAKAPRATAQAILGLAGTSLADLSADSAQASAPLLDCGTPTDPPTSTPPPTSQPPASTPAPIPTTVGVSSGTDSDELAVGPQKTPTNAPKVLSRTGESVMPTLWLSGVLLVAGLIAMAIGRRKVASPVGGTS